jgi:hypothetical protein
MDPRQDDQELEHGQERDQTALQARSIARSGLGGVLEFGYLDHPSDQATGLIKP